jgi:uncharacterized protein YjbI with pentapeptide repeats
MKSKDELVQLLKNGFVEEFNEFKKINESLDFAEIELSGCDVHGANFSGADLTGSDFGECNLSDVNFSDCDLSSVIFTRSSLHHTNFSNTTLAGAKFNHSEILNCDFTEADMTGVDFIEANLSNTDLSLSLNLNQCIFDSYTTWPDADNLPDDFEPEYIEDLSSLKDDDDELESEYGY